MAIRTFNSVGGFSVGETPETIILANGDITTDFATFTANMAAGKVKTDYLLKSDGTPWDFNYAAGSDGWVQFKTGDDLAASANLKFVDYVSGSPATPATLTLLGTANVTDLVATGNVTASDLYGNIHGYFTGTVAAPGGSGGNTNLVFNDNGNMNAVSGLTFVKSSNTLTVTGNINAANADLGNLVTANYIHGVLDSTSNAQPNITSVGTLISLNVTNNANIGGIANIVGNAIVGGNLSVTGNANVGNIGATNAVLTGNANVTGNLSVTGNSSITGDETVTGNVSVTGNVGANIATFTGNLSSLNANLGNLAIANYFQGTLTTAAQPNVTSLGRLTSLVVGNATANTTFGNGIFTATGNANVGNLGAEIGSFTGNVYALNANLGNLTTSNYFHGVLDATSNSQPNITSVGTLVSVSVTSTATVGNLSTAGYISATGNANVGNIGAENGVFTGTVTAGNIELTSNIAALNANLGNLVTANYFHGTFDATSSSQPNITTVGTLNGLGVTGNANVTNTVNTGNLNVTAKVISALIPSSDNTYDIGSQTNQWRNVYVGSNVFIGSQSYIRAIGNIIQTDAANVQNNLTAGTITVRGAATLQDDLTVAGNLTVSGSTTYINVTNTSIKDPLIDLGGSASGANATAYDGYDRGLVLHNYTTDGGGAVTNQAFIWKTTDKEFQAIGNVTDITDNTVTGTLGNMRSNVMFANLTGQVLTASQTNITTVGTLGNLTISGNLEVQTKANIDGANIRILTASGLKYPTSDGTSAQVIQTDGAGNLSFVTIDTYRIQNGVNNVTVYSGGNVGIKAGGTANVALFTSTGANITGVLNVSGNTNVDILNIGDSSLRSATITTNDTIPFVIASVNTAGGVRGAEFFVKGENSTGHKYSVATVSAVHDGTLVDFAVYGTVNLGGTTGTLTVVRGTNSLDLTVQPTSSDDTVWTTQYRTI